MIYRRDFLNAAARGDKTKLQEILRQFRLKVNWQDEFGQTAIWTASFEGHVDAVEFLLSKEANPAIAKKSGFNACHIASHEGHKEVLEALFKSGKVDIHSQIPNDGATALYLASLNGHVDAVEFLLRSGAKREMKTKDGQNAVFASARNGHTKTVELLLKSSKHPNLEANIQNFAGDYPLHVASREGHHDTVLALLNWNANVSVSNISGEYPLHVAISRNHVHIAKTLLKHQKSVVNEKTSAGLTPIFCARSVEAVRILREAGSDTQYLLWHAASHGHWDIFRDQLLEDPEQLLQPGPLQLTPFHYLLLDGNKTLEGVVKLMMEKNTQRLDWLQKQLLQFGHHEMCLQDLKMTEDLIRAAVESDKPETIEWARQRIEENDDTLKQKLLDLISKRKNPRTCQVFLPQQNLPSSELFTKYPGFNDKIEESLNLPKWENGETVDLEEDILKLALKPLCPLSSARRGGKQPKTIKMTEFEPQQHCDPACTQ